MKRILILLVLVFALALPVMAQTPAAVEPSIVVTPEPTAAATSDAAPVVINIEQPDAPAPVTPAPASDNTFERLGLLALLLLLVVDKISGHFMSMRLANMVPAEWRATAGTVVENAQRTGLQTAYNRAKETPEPWDDSFVIEGAKIIGWEFIENTDGSVTPRRKPVSSAG